MVETHTQLIVISGCSGGGKSTLINELSKIGYAVIQKAAPPSRNNTSSVKNS